MGPKGSKADADAKYVSEAATAAEEDELLVGGHNPDNSFRKNVSICIIVHLLYVILPFTGLLLPIYLAIFHERYRHRAILLAVTYWTYVFTNQAHKQHGRPWKWAENHPLIRYLFEWFPVRILRTSKLDPAKKYVLACAPHGVLAFNRAAVGFCTEQLWDKAFPGVTFRVLTASAAFYLPVIRELWLWSYCVDASKKTAQKVMRDLGSSVFVYPGGEKEQMETMKVTSPLKNSCAKVDTHLNK